MAELLVIISCLAVLVQKTKQRVLVASLYSGLCYTHMVIENNLADVQYFVLAGMFCVIIVKAIFQFTEQTRFTDGMVTVSACSFLANLYGYAIYCMGMEPTSYVAISCAVMLGGLWVMLRKDLANESCGDNGLGLLHGPLGLLGNYYGKLYRKAKP